MGLHKLTAGDGYTYLTRQVAAHDATERGHVSLGDYYDEQGESPGRWLGAGLAGLGMSVGEGVSEEQMASLFGEGRHPNARQLEAAALGTGAGKEAALAVGALGRRFSVYDAASKLNVQVAREFTAYNRDRGLAWNAAIPAEERARIRTAVATRMFTHQHGRGPQDARELSGFVARASRQATTAVAGYDLTFSPVKSISTLWALAPREIADQIQAAHDAAVQDTIGWLEREVAYTRLGRAGARQVAVRGLVAAAFTHRDSRAADPDLHTHVAVSNKVQTRDEAGVGRWLSLDGRILYRAKVAASERYNTRLEAEVAARLGVRFCERETPSGKRPVREITGINPLLNRWWSSRRRDIEVRRSELAAGFQSRHGRPPTAVEAIDLAQQATLETRQAKHAPRIEAEQRATWRQQANEVLGGTLEVEAMIQGSLGRRSSPTTRPTTEWVASCGLSVVATLEASRATWQVWHVRAEAERHARAAGIGLRDLDAAVDRVVTEALSCSTRLGTPDPVREPAPLRRADGESVYEVHGSARYTSARVLAAEQRLLATAKVTGGRRISEVRVEIAIAAEAADGIDLNDAQAAMVRDLATSGSRLQLALAPAGTGKTTAMRVLGRAWTEAGGYVLGLAPSAQAAQELGHALEGHTDTLTKLTWTLSNAPRDQWPGWVDRIGPRTLVILDEAGQAATTELAAAVDYITARGGSVRLIGDDQQLASVGAGGTLRDLQHSVGAATLSEVRRFHDHAEAAATLALRDGDASALGFYADHDRIHVGDIGSVTDQAYDAWAADRRTGLDSILLAPTRDLVTRLNARARADRLYTLPGHDRGHDRGGKQGWEVRLVDGNHVCTGDTIVTRRNERRLVTTGRSGDWVKNGDRWTVTEVHPDGGLTARHLDHQHDHVRSVRSVALPAGYVSEHVQLGYAATVHAAQGMTTDTAHVVVAGDEPRQLLYVALTRGRAANHLYLANAHDGDPHTLIRPETLLPPTAIDVLTDILARDGSQQSATTTSRELDSPATRLHQAATRFHDALGYAAEHALCTETLTGLDRQVEALWPGLTDEPAYPTLRSHLALQALDDKDPFELLLDAAAARELSSADDRAAVLDWRLLNASGSDRTKGPLPWLDPLPDTLRAHPDWGPYLEARATTVTCLAEQVRYDAVSWSPTGTPQWAAPLTASAHADLRADLSLWRAAFAVPESDTRPTGPRQPAADAAAHQYDLERRTRQATGHSRGSTRPNSWRDLLPDCVTTDPALTRLRHRVESLDRAGVRVDQLLRRALDHPRPLPDEHAADALWWRVVGHLGPAALRAAGHSATTLRPAWTPALVERLGREAAERVMADPAWPALVAAIHARPAEWSAEQLIHSAADGRNDAVVPVEELCTALIWRFATLTDEPEDPESQEPAPPDPQGIEAEPPDDLHALTTPSTPESSSASGTPVERIVELNQAALDYYTDLYPRSWAPDYIHDRLGTHLSDEPRFTFGYAPPGPTSLIRHLTGHGATETELLNAGLARQNDRGRLVDAFRDRVVFAIYQDQDLVGFIGRRNPTKDEAQYTGPKYLNTRTTAAFTKGEQLFGLTEGADALAAGATPVLVEGPLDAIAVTTATGGRAVGIAPLGTAFTDAQAVQLKPFFRDDPAQVVIATDPDAAGWTSAQRAFWRLAQYGANPRHVTLPDGVDPADLLRTQGPQAMNAALAETQPFATALLDTLADETAGELDVPATRLRVVRQAGEIIGALPPREWIPHIERVTAQLGLPTGMLHLEVSDAGHAWTNDPERAAAQRLADLTAPRAGPSRRPREAEWRAQLEQFSPGLTHTPEWEGLRGCLRRAHATGHDTSRLLPQVLHHPLAPGYPAASQLQHRLATVLDHDSNPRPSRLIPRVAAPRRVSAPDPTPPTVAPRTGAPRR